MTFQHGLPVELLVDAARFALGRNMLRTSQLRQQLLTTYNEAEQLLDRLSRWQIVSYRRQAAPRLVLINPQHAETVVAVLIRNDGIPPLPNPLAAFIRPGLSDQHRAVLDGVAQGYSNEEIGQRMGIKAGTVKGHVHRLTERLDARNRAHLIDLAHRLTLLPNPHLASKKDSHP